MIFTHNPIFDITMVENVMESEYILKIFLRLNLRASDDLVF